MRVLSIIYDTAADGPGLRNSLYVAGCAHHCPGCHNPESWNFAGGSERDVEKLAQMLCEYSTNNITISGGDPFYQYEDLIELCKIIKTKYHRNIWVYTGFTKEELDKHHFNSIYKYIDAIVDGKYIQELHDTSLQFRGSSNQRILLMQSM